MRPYLASINFDMGDRARVPKDDDERENYGGVVDGGKMIAGYARLLLA